MIFISVFFAQKMKNAIHHKAISREKLLSLGNHWWSKKTKHRFHESISTKEIFRNPWQHKLDESIQKVTAFTLDEINEKKETPPENDHLHPPKKTQPPQQAYLMHVLVSGHTLSILTSLEASNIVNDTNRIGRIGRKAHALRHIDHEIMVGNSPENELAFCPLKRQKPLTNRPS